MVTKQRRLQLAELMGTPSLKDEPEAPKVEKSDGFAKQMIEKIVQNIQLFVNKVHVRYEDSISSPGVRGLPLCDACGLTCALQSTFCAGLTLELLHAQSANEKWEPTFLTLVTKIVNKVFGSLFCVSRHIVHCKRCYDVSPREF